MKLHPTAFLGFVSLKNLYYKTTLICPLKPHFSQSLCSPLPSMVAPLKIMKTLSILSKGTLALCFSHFSLVFRDASLCNQVGHLYTEQRVAAAAAEC